ncbi:hypothetical protein FWC63_01045 [Candidatus Saccharibacteria bacterium]|nr:hypothetical protein [Candidatus Saccharibacteria bacterium]
MNNNKTTIRGVEITVRVDEVIIEPDATMLLAANTVRNAGSCRRGGPPFGDKTTVIGVIEAVAGYSMKRCCLPDERLQQLEDAIGKICDMSYWRSLDAEMKVDLGKLIAHINDRRVTTLSQALVAEIRSILTTCSYDDEDNDCLDEILRLLIGRTPGDPDLKLVSVNYAALDAFLSKMSGKELAKLRGCHLAEINDAFIGRDGAYQAGIVTPVVIECLEEAIDDLINNHRDLMPEMDESISTALDLERKYAELQ